MRKHTTTVITTTVTTRNTHGHTPDVEVDDCVVQELIGVQAGQVQRRHLHRTGAAARRVQARQALRHEGAWWWGS